MRIRTQLLPLIASTVLVAGCAQKTHQPMDPGAINHVVLFTLQDPSQGEALQRDCAARLKHIPSVVAYACGEHVDAGRQNVDGDYTLGLFVSFQDMAGYKAYLVHPDHVALVEKWKPRFSEVTIYDIGNESSKDH